MVRIKLCAKGKEEKATFLSVLFVLSVPKQVRQTLWLAVWFIDPAPGQTCSSAGLLSASPLPV